MNRDLSRVRLWEKEHFEEEEHFISEPLSKNLFSRVLEDQDGSRGMKRPHGVKWRPRSGVFVTD